jgi:enamine deaminase RidA (YjgF/YER057c/UK114 family)
MTVEERAAALGITIPAAPAPKGSYRSVILIDRLVFTAGVGPIYDGIRPYVGYVGDDISIDQARKAARLAALNAVGLVRSAIDDLQTIERIVKLTGYVRSAHGFTGQTLVLDAASDLLLQLFGERGRHVRTAVGVAELPFGIPVEIEIVAQCHQAERTATP